MAAEQLSKIDERLRDIAIKDWAQFLSLLGKEKLTIAKVRLLRAEGKSYNQIASRLNITLSQVRHAISTDKEI